MGGALCEICRRVMNGESISPEQLRQYKLSKGARTDVSMLLMPDEPDGPKFSIKSMGGDIIEALGFTKKKPPVEPTKSVGVVHTKTRGPLFDGAAIGSMLDIDEQLRSPKE